MHTSLIHPASIQGHAFEGRSSKLVGACKILTGAGNRIIATSTREQWRRLSSYRREKTEQVVNDLELNVPH